MRELRPGAEWAASDLLSTKLALPRARALHVPRETLLASLDRALEHTLTVLSAPAGFGKTTLARSWVTAHGDEQECLGIAWLALDAGDNDPVRFWRYMIAACQRLDEWVGDVALERLASRQPFALGQVHFEEIVTSLLNDLDRLSRPGVLILEDYHVINSPQIHEALTFFIDYLPIDIHVIVLTRIDPPLPLARWRARGDLLEVRASDMNFSLEETRAFLQQALAFPLAEEMVVRLHERTEGWVAGLNVVVSALRGHSEPQEQEAFLETLTGSYRPLLEYLVSDVLHTQPEELQTFLLRTSILNRLSGSLCDAVTGESNSAHLLERIERANLFLEPLDGAGQWYRYHTLFAEAMQHEARRSLGKGGLQGCYARAGDWYERHGYLTDAVESALLAEDYERVARVLERVSGSLSIFRSNEFYTLRRWCEQLPQQVLEQFPALCLIYASVLLFELDGGTVRDDERYARSEELLHMAERQWRSADDMEHIGAVYAFRSLLRVWQGRLLQANRLAHQALDCLRDDDVAWRSIAVSIAGTWEMHFGSLEEARRMMQESLVLSQESGNIYGVRAVRLELCKVYIAQGALELAGEQYKQILAEAGNDLHDRGQALLGLSQLAYEGDRLEEAAREAQEARDLGQRLADEELEVFATLALARVKQALGQVPEARQLVEGLMPERLTLNPSQAREALFWLTWLRWRDGDDEAVQRWMRQRDEDEEELSPILSTREELLVARCLMANDKVSSLQLLTQCLERSQRQQYTDCVIEARALLARLYFRQGNLEMAGHMLRELASYARPEGYRRLLLDEGSDLAKCIRAVIPAGSENADERFLYTLFPPEKTKQEREREATLLIEPLSAQEQRVLRLFVAGLSKPEIARELVVSVNTVKTHLLRIYRKLNVTSRAEAREVARHLRLT